MSQSEECAQPLAGGLIDRVVRIGDTVRRPSGPWTPTIHALLDHLAAKGFSSPRARGLDESGREILTYLHGEAALWPWPDALRRLDGARQIGRLLRRYHDAVVDFAPPAPAIWQAGERPLGEGEIVSHGDLNPSNLLWRDGVLVGLIDFDLAFPAHSLRDLANAAYTCVPLCPDEAAAPLGFVGPPDRRSRLEALARAYGLTDTRLLLAEVEALLETELLRIETLGAEGREPWRTFLDRGLANRAVRDQHWLAAHLESLRAS